MTNESSSRELNQELKEFQALLAKSEHLNPETLQALEELASDIRKLLESRMESSGMPLGREGILERLTNWIERFESQHPELTKTLSMVSERLADMGI